MPIRTFLFDLGNVLLRFSHERMVAQVAAECGRPPAWVKAWLIDGGRQWRFERGEVSEAEFAAELSRDSGQTVSVAAFRRALADIFVPNPPMEEYVRDLGGRGHRLVLLSNTCASHIAWIRERYTVLEPFDELVLSHEVGAMKPDAPIFRAALNAIGCPPGECFYTDDIPAYVTAGGEHGLDAELFTTPDAFVEQLRQRGIAL
jgi:putative hydrolase of the HAD superfamily